jgi:hypothetical protein
MTPSPYKEAQDMKSTEVSVEEQEVQEEEEFEFLTTKEDEESPSWTFETYEPSIRDRTAKPVEVSETGIDERPSQAGKWQTFDQPEKKPVVQPILKRGDNKPAQAVLKAATKQPAFTFSRPDKQTVQAILAKKKKEELQKRIGKEPGDNDDGLDFEDFMNMVKKGKK